MDYENKNFFIPVEMNKILIFMALMIMIGIVIGIVYMNKEEKLNNNTHKIKHIIFIIQENRAFDHYFGTFPGADGIPMINGTPTVCVPDPYKGKCVKPYHDSNDKNKGGPHNSSAAIADINKGKMDGFIKQRYDLCSTNPYILHNYSKCYVDVMGYHDYREIPNYWTYAMQFVLQDHMFSSARSWSLPNHLYIFSSWSAECKSSDPMTCKNDLEPKTKGIYSWTDITYLLHKNNIDWALYEDEPSPDEDEDWFSIVNPLQWFETVKDNREIKNIKPISKFYENAEKGTLQSVVWIVPNLNHSEHPPALVSDGQEFVTNIVNAIMKSPNWESSAIFIFWDEYGGFYDHLPPPDIDQNGYGIRVPGLVISPYAKRGYIDHQNLSFDAYLKFIEDVFLNGQRIDPKTDGRPDKRPTVRENVSILGDLMQDFNFSQSPREPIILSSRYQISN